MKSKENIKGILEIKKIEDQKTPAMSTDI